MAKTITLVDLVLHATVYCHMCRQGARPVHEDTQEHGELFHHKIGDKWQRCEASAVWSLIHKMEAAS